MQFCKHAFPVRLVEYFNPNNQTWCGRRGPGQVVADGQYCFGANPATDVELCIAEDAEFSIQMSAKLCEKSLKQLFVYLQGDADLKVLLEKLVAKNLNVEFLKGDEYLLTLDSTRNVLSVACDQAILLSISTKIAGKESNPVISLEQGAFELLLSLGQLHVLLCWLGWTQRQALRKVIDLYAGFSEADRAGLQNLLIGRYLDSGNVFAIFLNRISLEKPDQVLWQDQQITWLLGQDKLDLPYQRQAAIDKLNQSGDADEQRFQLFHLLRDYDRELERSNINRIAEQVQESRQQLIFGRMSRAFHNQATLFANAVLLQPGPTWRQFAEELSSLAKQTLAIQASAMVLVQMLNSHDEIPLTQLEGACERFELAVIEAQKQALLEGLQTARNLVENHNDSLTSQVQPESPHTTIMALAEQCLRLVEQIRREFLRATKRHAAYVIISQRPSPTGSHLLTKINEFQDPYAGKSENLRKLVRLAGDRIYSSPDYGWLEVADHWIEAIPLFIKEEVLVHNGQETTRTVIDISGMEVSFREEMADRWAKNLTQVLESEFISLARETFGRREFAVAEAAQPSKTIAGEATEIAALSVFIAEIYRRNIQQVHRLIEFEELTALAAMQQILLQSELMQEAEVSWRETHSWAESISELLQSIGYAKSFEAELSRFKPLVWNPTRVLPTLHILTTQSAGMTDAYIRSWLEESMALYNIVTDLGLHEQVAEREKFYTARLLSLGEKVIREWGAWIEVEDLCAAEQLSEAAAILRLINRNRLIQNELSCLGALLEIDEAQQGRGQAQNWDEPKAVTEYLQNHAEALQDAALHELVSCNKDALSKKLAELTSKEAKTESPELLKRLVLADEFYQQDIQAYMQSLARRQVLEELAAKYPHWCLKSNCDSYLRRFQQLRKTSARKEIIAELGLNHLAMQPHYYYQASGGGKRYHLIYTPSRVDLGHRERESVETWSQWIGGADRTATQAGQKIYSLINKDVRIFNSLTEPEILKTGENASMASHFGFSNALSLMVTASRYGDFEEMADLMNRRQDRYIHPAGEGYGGYCVPKDGLFLEFVLTLNQTEKLRQIGLADIYHVGAIALANRLLDSKPQFVSQLEWESWAAEQLASQKYLQPYFSVKNGLPVFQITRIAHVLENFGKPEIRDQFRIASSLAAGWGLHKMVNGGEQVNRFMPFFKAWLIRQGIMAAARRQPQAAISFENCVLVLSAEYKPDTQDARFATGLRKFEILTGLGGHLVNALDLEGQLIAVLMHEGVPGIERRGWFGRLLEMLHIGTEDQTSLQQLAMLFPAGKPPAEIRVVSPMLLSVQDLLDYTSDAELAAAANQTRAKLLDLGLNSKEIEANLRTWGPRLSRWDLGAELAAGINREALVPQLETGMHALALATLGPERNYEYAAQGADIIDTGIPHRSLLELLADPVKLCRLMLEGNPNSALAIIDGAAGARHRAMNRQEVMLWFAAGERLGKEAVYISVGIGEQTVEAWRLDMRRRRRRAERLWNAIVASGVSDQTGRAQQLYADIVDEINQNREIYAALAEIDKLQRFGRQSRQNRLLTEFLTQVCSGKELAQLKFAEFLALGGVYQFLGASAAEIQAALTAFATGIVALGGSPDQSDMELIALLLCRQEQSKPAEFREEKGIESSNKATEERLEVAVESRRQLANRIARASALNQRQSGFASVTPDEHGFLQHYQLAMRALGASNRLVSEQCFGMFLGHTRNALLVLVSQLAEPENPAVTLAIQTRFQQLFSVRQIDELLIQQIAGGYEDIGDFGRMAQAIRESAQQGKIDAAAKQLALGYVAQAAELFYIMQAIDSTITLVSDEPVSAEVLQIWRALCSFFAKTINDHSYEYRPWVYSRGTGFADLQGEELYTLAVERHLWLYGYLRFIVTHNTELKLLPEHEQDLLLGNFLDGKQVIGIGAGAYGGVAENIWRAYGQLRELAFIRNDGLPIPEVFAEFNPELIQAEFRVNHIIAAPVGRTHFSRVLCEGPILARELEQAGRRGGNLIITRKFDILEQADEIVRPVATVSSGHLYLAAETFCEALMVHKGYSKEAAAQHCAKLSQPKGIRVAVNFTRPVLAALVYPFHGNPEYKAGKLEACGLPYTVQSLFHTWTTYDKTKYQDIFRNSGVELPAETAWLAEFTLAAKEKCAVISYILQGLPDSDYPGLLAFARQYPLVMIKDATESGGRNAQAFALGLADGSLDQTQLDLAAKFIYQISLRHHVCIQEVILSSPEYWATEVFMRDFVRRQIVEWGSAVNRQRHPYTSIFGSHRIILSTANPTEPDLEHKWHISHWITLNSKQLITNLGRGGCLDQLLPEFIRPEHRQTILEKLAAAGRQVMEAMAAYETKCATAYTQETGRPVGADLMGVSYGMPRYLMLDFLITPVFDQAGRLVELAAVCDEKGNRVGSRFMLQHGQQIVSANMVDWRIVLIEPNIGVGLWDRLALREEYHELEAARKLGVNPNWEHIGENARLVLQDLNQAGEDYLNALQASNAAFP